ncbi:P-loop ATPase, Sll1717 family [Cystobacter fuscus]|uniref:P-loop ATPase, Sll1717 family n=1 Tax=Cystobacter fuscus TaxID=43 RepID=UPI0012DE662A|nr:hypothetical protein [Cystobacter fuscus]
MAESTTAPPRRRSGNILGELAGESDREMLDAAFFETATFRELAVGEDFRFVVGRRGAGKSALFQKLHAHLEATNVPVIAERPQPEIARSFQAKLRTLSAEYDTASYITKLTWKVQVLSAALERLKKHYKFHRVDDFDFLENYHKQHPALFEKSGMNRSLFVLESVLSPGLDADEIPRIIAERYNVNALASAVSNTAAHLNQRIVVLYDALDAGWVPTPIATAILGGLAKIAAECREQDSRVHCILFIRDNMLRALSHLDNDYTRDIEGNVLRLQWEEESLLKMVAMRLRVAFDWKGENDLKAWSRFAQRGLEGREGFRTCLRYTLYRPRDVIALLNSAYQIALQAGRQNIIESDLDPSAARISRDRLQDLFREYHAVLPGLDSFARLFQGRPSVSTYAEIHTLLEDSAHAPLTGAAGRDFALLNSGAEIFSALYSVGFLGIRQPDRETFGFCHDGSDASPSTMEPLREIIIHPCYWKALEIQSTLAPEQVVMRIDDVDDAVAEGDTEAEGSSKKRVNDIRMRKLGETVDELRDIEDGQADAAKFERWVLRAITVLFGEHLENIQKHPNAAEHQRRDIVGTIKTDSGIWGRILHDYGVRQCIFEVKNYRELGPSEFRQVWGYLSGQYGKLAFIITKSPDEAMSRVEKQWIKEGWREHQKMVVVIPAFLLQRALNKLRSPTSNKEYADKILRKRLDALER